MAPKQSLIKRKRSLHEEATVLAARARLVQDVKMNAEEAQSHAAQQSDCFGDGGMQGGLDDDLAKGLEASLVDKATLESLASRLDERLAALGWKRQQVPQDGNCFYTVLVQSGIAATLQECRQHVADYEEAHWNEVTPDSWDVSKADHIARTRTLETSAQEPDLHAAAGCYGLQIVILHPLDEDPFVFGDPASENQCFLAWDGRRHYDGVVLAVEEHVEELPMCLNTLQETRGRNWIALCTAQIRELRARLTPDSASFREGYEAALDALPPGWRDAWVKRQHCIVAWQVDKKSLHCWARLGSAKLEDRPNVLFEVIVAQCVVLAIRDLEALAALGELSSCKGSTFAERWQTVVTQRAQSDVGVKYDLMSSLRTGMLSTLMACPGSDLVSRVGAFLEQAAAATPSLVKDLEDTALSGTAFGTKIKMALGLKNDLRALAVARFLLAWGMHVADIPVAGAGAIRGLAYLFDIAERTARANSEVLLRSTEHWMRSLPSTPEREWLLSQGIVEGVMHVQHQCCELSKVVHAKGRRHYAPKAGSKSYQEYYAAAPDTILLCGRMESGLLRSLSDNANQGKEAEVVEEGHLEVQHGDGGLPLQHPLDSFSPAHSAVAAGSQAAVHAARSPSTGRGRHAGRSAHRIVVKDPAIAKGAFQRLVREVLAEECHKKGLAPMRMDGKAVGALHAAAEAYVVQVFGDANQCMQHSQSATVTPQDLSLAIQLRVEGGDHLLDGWTSLHKRR